MENAGVDSRGGKCRSKPYGTPTRDFIETTLSYFVILILILVTLINSDLYYIIKNSCGLFLYIGGF